jgi:hypothetical protein
VIDDLETLLKQASNPADMAVVLLAGTVGFVADAGLNLIGFLSPGVVGIAAATSALGVKRGVDAWRLRRQQLRAEHLLATDLLRRVEIIRLMLRADSTPHEAFGRLQREVELYEAGLSSIENLHEAVDEAVDWLRRGEPATQPVGPQRTRRLLKRPLPNSD